MVTLDPLLMDQPIPGPVVFERVQGKLRRAALALLLTGNPCGQDPAVDRFLHFARAREMSVAECWAALEMGVSKASSKDFSGAASSDIRKQMSHEISDQLPGTGQKSVRASFLVVPSAGKTAMAFMSPIQSRRDVSLMGQLVGHVLSHQNPADLRLLQLLLDPGQRLERQALMQGGLSPLADLVYMQRPRMAEDVRACSPWGGGLEMYTWSEARRPLFADAILASYEDTLDCPALRGVRQIEDILAGHMACGQFDPTLWHVVCREDQPLAVMLLARLEPQNALELVYLGVVPSARGQHLATRLLAYAGHRMAADHTQRLILAVDQKNHPAIRLYKRFGFIAYERKHAMIHIFDA